MLTPSVVEPAHRYLGQAGYGIVEATVGDVGIGSVLVGEAWPKGWVDLSPKCDLKVSFRKDDNIQKQKAQPRKRANWQMGESRIHGL
jgi:hypothetical protein